MNEFEHYRQINDRENRLKLILDSAIADRNWKAALEADKRLAKVTRKLDKLRGPERPAQATPQQPQPSFKAIAHEVGQKDQPDEVGSRITAALADLQKAPAPNYPAPDYNGSQLLQSDNIDIARRFRPRSSS